MNRARARRYLRLLRRLGCLAAVCVCFIGLRLLAPSMGSGKLQTWLVQPINPQNLRGAFEQLSRPQTAQPIQRVEEPIASPHPASVAAVTASAVRSGVVEGANPRPESQLHIQPSSLEIVVASFCENPRWFARYRGPVTVYAKNNQCLVQLQAAVTANSIRGRVVELPNVGREGHTYVRHILDNWDNLSLYTAFTQGAGTHNGVKDMDYIADFMRNGPSKNVTIVPIVHRNDQGYILYRDKDYNENVARPNQVDKKTNLHIFDVGDQADHARVLYAALFGGSPCKAPPMVFAAGAQFIVHRNSILSKPKPFWEWLLRSFEDWINFGYDMERLWLHVFDPARQPKQSLKFPHGFWTPNEWRPKCKTYVQQTDVSPLQLQWKLKPSTAPLHEGVDLEIMGDRPIRAAEQEASKKAEVSTSNKASLKRNAPDSGKCTWEVSYDAWFGGGTQEMYEPSAHCLELCCADKECVGIAWKSEMADGQCYKFDSLPEHIDDHQFEPLSTFDQPAESKWSFFKVAKHLLRLL